MCNAIQYYVEQSNKKVAAETEAKVRAEIAAETKARVSAEIAAEKSEIIRKALKERNQAIIRLFQMGNSVELLSDAFELSQSEIEEIISSQQSC